MSVAPGQAKIAQQWRGTKNSNGEKTLREPRPNKENQFPSGKICNISTSVNKTSMNKN